MKTTRVTALLACVAVLAFASGVAFTEDAPKPKPLTPAEMEQKVFQMGAKCPEHERLQKLVGTWDLQGKAFSHMMGEIPFGGVVTYTPKWDGRFLDTTYEGPPGMDGKPLRGAGVLGYNRLSGKYEGTWMMSAHTHITFITGVYDEKQKAIVYTGSMEMPDGTTWGLRQVFTFVSDDKLTEEQWTTPPGGKESMTVTMTYTRKKADAPTTGK